MPEETSKYQKEWDGYKERKSLGCLIALIIIPVFLLLRYFLPQLPDYFGGILFVAFVFAVFISMFFKGFWKCPRCGHAFDYGKRTVPAKKCIECNLPLYYGSSYFYDYWGSEQGNDLTRKIREGKQ